MSGDRKIEAKVAFLLSRPQPDGKPITQQQVAAQLGMRQPQISRIFKKLCDEQKIAKVRVVNVLPRLSDTPEWQQVSEEYDEAKHVAKSIAVSSPYAAVFRLRLVSGYPRNPKEFGSASAPIVYDLLANARRIGVGCGRSINVMARALVEHNSMTGKDSPEGRKLRIVPILGEPNHLQNRDQHPVFSASLIAETMRQSLLGGLAFPMPVLRGVPAYIARRFRTMDLHRLFEDIRGYRDIFVGKTAEIDQLDTILTGVGIVSPDSEDARGTMIKELIEQEGDQSVEKDPITVERLDRLIDGEIAGILLAKSGNEKAELISTLNEGLLGLKERHLRRVCVRVHSTRREERPAGCVVLAYGNKKIHVVANAIRRGLITTLVTTRDFAFALSRALSAHEG
jgi:DNA-binding transcriptional regulator LsrR (DeoR family)